MQLPLHFEYWWHNWNWRKRDEADDWKSYIAYSKINITSKTMEQIARSVERMFGKKPIGKLVGQLGRRFLSWFSSYDAV
jgi:hypothetical protein